jgi:hypothetical protein
MLTQRFKESDLDQYDDELACKQWRIERPESVNFKLQNQDKKQA